MSGKKDFVKRLGYIHSTLWLDRKPSSSWFISRLGQSNLAPISSQYDSCRYKKAMSVPTWWSGEVSVLGGSVKAKKISVVVVSLSDQGGLSLKPNHFNTYRLHIISPTPHQYSAVEFNCCHIQPSGTFSTHGSFIFKVKSVKENYKKRQPQWKGDPDGFWPLTSGETPQQTATKYNQLILTYPSVIDLQLKSKTQISKVKLFFLKNMPDELACLASYNG